MSEWREVTLKYVLGDKGYIRGPFGSSLKRAEMHAHGIPVYEQKNAIYNDRTFRFFIDEQKFRELSRFQVKTNDLIISCSGTVGKISIIKDKDPKGIISQALLILRPDVSKVELLFLYHFLSSRQGIELLTQASHGSVQINIAERKVVENIPLLLPPLPEQKAIAGVLSSLDDKIDLLHRQNKTLEAMAEALFRKWFVEEADEGWEEGKLGDIVEFNYGIALKEEKRSGNGYPVVGSSGIVGFHDEFYVKSPGIVTGRKGTLGVINYIFDNFTPIDTSFYITSRIGSDLLLFEYFLLRNCGLENMNSDSAVPGLNRNTAHSIFISIPPKELIIMFNDAIKPFFEKIKENQSQIRTLEKLRDALLPKLMSGEVRVKGN